MVSKVVKQKKVTEHPARRAILRKLSEVEREEVKWLWQPYLPLGKLVILDGDPGVGKTTLALDFCASVTLGRSLGPNSGSRKTPRNVMFLTAEDGLGDTIRPRFEDLGGELERFHALEGRVREDGKETAFTSLLDWVTFEDALRQCEPALVVIDPLNAFVGGGTDTNQDNKLREVLTPLARSADKYGCTILCLRHLRKESGGPAIYAGLGSIGLISAVRSGLIVALHPEEHEVTRVMAHSKCNLARLGRSYSFTVGEGVLEWGEVESYTADDLMRPPEEQYGPRLREARGFLEDQLAGEGKSVTELLEAARAKGVSESTLREAAKEMGVKKQRVGEKGRRGGGFSLWKL